MKFGCKNLHFFFNIISQISSIFVPAFSQPHKIIMIALVAIVFPTSIEDLLGQVFMVGKGFAAVYAYKKVKKYITPQIKDKVEAKLDEWFHENVTEVVEPLYLE